MVEALIAGLALGGVYALASAGVVLTYVSAGVLNLAFASLAYFIARFYYFLHIQHGWAIAPAAILSILVLGPVLGVLQWALLFRHLQLASTLVRLVATIGLSVCLGPIAILLFGNIAIASPPGLASQPVKVFQVLGSSVTLDQIIVYACAILLLGGGGAILKFTSAGLKVRAVVSSPALSALNGIRPSRVAVAVWAVTTMMAGLVGVLATPIIGLDINSFTVLIAASFAAVVVARLSHIGVAVGVALLMGLATTIVEQYLPSTSQFTGDAIPSIPFAFTFLFLVYTVIRRGSLRDSRRGSSGLDAAIAPRGGSEMAAGLMLDDRPKQWILSVAAVAAVAVAVLLVHGIWSGLIGLGAVYGIVFLSNTVVAGDGGIIWLCQISFAGIGAFATADLATNHGWPVLLAAVAGGILCGLVGTVIGALTVRLGDIYVALVTLTFGLLVENIVFQWPSFSNYGAGITTPHPSFAEGSTAFTWFALAAFCVVALIVATVRRSTFGLAVVSARWSEAAASMTSINVVLVKIALSAFAAMIAGVGGGLLAMYTQAAEPGGFATIEGLVWLAVLVTVGIRSNIAALVAGLAFVLIPEVFTAYLPVSWGEVPPALFGLGAILLARHPEGTLAVYARQLESLISRTKRSSGSSSSTVGGAVSRSAGVVVATSPVEEGSS